MTILVRSGDLAAAAPASSVDELAEGDLLGLLTSGLPAAVPLAMPQIALTALAAAVVISREGATVWWVAALVGHVGSALISYGVVGLASALGSGAARDAENDPDYGISAVLAATLGALLASGLRAGDRVAVAVGAGGLAALLPFSIGWLGIQHCWPLGSGRRWRSDWVRPSGILPTHAVARPRNGRRARRGICPRVETGAPVRPRRGLFCGRGQRRSRAPPSRAAA